MDLLGFEFLEYGVVFIEVFLVVVLGMCLVFVDLGEFWSCLCVLEYYFVIVCEYEFNFNIYLLIFFYLRLGFRYILIVISIILDVLFIKYYIY